MRKGKGLDGLELSLIPKSYRSAKEQLESNLFEAQQQNSVIQVTKGQLEVQIQTIIQAKEVIQGESPAGMGHTAFQRDSNSQESSESFLLPDSGSERKLLLRRVGREKEQGRGSEAILPDVIGEVKCLKLELDAERTRAEQEWDAVARQLAQAEQEGQASLERQKVAHEEEVNRLQEKWVGGGCDWDIGEADMASLQ